MWTDQIGMVCCVDRLLEDMGCPFLELYEQDPYDSKMKKTLAHMRTLARLLEEAREIRPKAIIEAKDLINHCNFSGVCIIDIIYI